MRDEAALPLTVRLHALVSRLSRDGGYIIEQGDVAEGATRIVQLERALASVLDHIDRVPYLDAAGSRLGPATPVLAAARTVLGGTLPASERPRRSSLQTKKRSPSRT